MAISRTEVGIYCKDCKDRYVGCHSSCEKYMAAKEEYEILHEKISRQKRNAAVNRTYVRDAMDKIRRSHGKH